MVRTHHRVSHQQRTEHGAGLIHRGVDAESPTVADLAGSLGEQHVARRPAQALAGALHHHQQRGHLPVAGEGHGRHHHQVQNVPADGYGPVGPRAVYEAAGKEAQAGGDHLAEACDQPHGGGAGAQILQEGADDAVRAFVGHVREQTDHAQADDEAERGGAFLFGDHEFVRYHLADAGRKQSRRFRLIK